MEKSESIKNIAMAMNRAQGVITAAVKDATNPFFKSSYADLGAVIKAVKAGMFENGLSYMQSPVMNDSGVGVTTLIMHISGEWIQDTLILPITKLDPQAAGSAITYARRYSLQSLMGLPSADDDAEFAMERVAPVDYSALQATAAAIIDLINNDDSHAVCETWSELDKAEMEYLWKAKSKGGFFTQDEKTYIREAKKLEDV